MLGPFVTACKEFTSLYPTLLHSTLHHRCGALPGVGPFCDCLQRLTLFVLLFFTWHLLLLYYIFTWQFLFYTLTLTWHLLDTYCSTLWHTLLHFTNTVVHFGTLYFTLLTLYHTLLTLLLHFTNTLLHLIHFTTLYFTPQVWGPFDMDFAIQVLNVSQVLSAYYDFFF